MNDLFVQLLFKKCLHAVHNHDNVMEKKIQATPQPHHNKKNSLIIVLSLAAALLLPKALS
tara:strand:+ start:249 stop:428 length:180 start_codon:yes stop_codon:yes gene_type:complete